MKSKSLAVLLPFLLPLLALLGWAGSGRENFTKPEKAVEITEIDAFGDAGKRVVFQRGPLAGYYIGLFDVVFPTFVAAGVAAGVVAFVQFRAARKKAKGIGA